MGDNMSWENVPKNLTEESVLVRDGKPDYTKLEAGAFPVPSADEAGAILENSDTGDRFRWTGAVWVQVAAEGRTITEPNDWTIAVSSGNIAGALDERLVGRGIGVSRTVFRTLWDNNTDLTYLTADTQLYASSSSALDTDVTLLVQGLDEDYEEISRLVTLNGQTQVALSGLMFRVHAAIVLDTSPVGVLYIAESDTLSGGVPTTDSKIKSSIILAPNDSGPYASFNITHNGFYTVPAGKMLHILGIFNTVSRADDITIDIRVRSQGGAWLSLNMVWAYESPAPLPYMQKPQIDEKSDIEIRVLASGANQVVEVNAQFILIDK